MAQAQSRTRAEAGAAGRGALPRAAGRAALLAAALLLPGACSLFGEDEPPPPCPPLVSPDEIDHLTRFDGAGRDLTDVLFRARLREVTGTCAYEDDDTLVESDMLVTFEVERGPALRRLEGDSGSQTASFSYFVAVATAGEPPRILTRQAFDVQVGFEGNRGRLAVTDEIAPRIPLKPGEDGNDYRIYIGIELNRAELEYNRENR